MKKIIWMMVTCFTITLNAENVNVNKPCFDSIDYTIVTDILKKEAQELAGYAAYLRQASRYDNNMGNGDYSTNKLNRINNILEKMEVCPSKKPKRD